MLCLPSTNSIKSSLFTRHKELEKEKEKPRNKVTSWYRFHTFVIGLHTHSSLLLGWTSSQSLESQCLSCYVCVVLGKRFELRYSRKKNKASTTWHRQSWLSARDLFRSVLIRLAWQRHLCSQSILNVWRCFEDVSNCDNRSYSILFPSIEARLFLWILKYEFDLTCCFYYTSQKHWAPSLEGLSNFGNDLKSIVLLFSFAVGL